MPTERPDQRLRLDLGGLGRRRARRTPSESDAETTEITDAADTSDTTVLPVETEPTTVITPEAEGYVAPPEAAPAPVATEPASATTATTAASPAPAPAASSGTTAARRRATTAARRAGRQIAGLRGWRGAMLGGLAAGVALVALTKLSLLGCTLVNGYDSCGTVPGMALLVVVFVLSVLVGGIVLRAAQVAEPVSTSFIGVGITTVIALLFLVPVLETWPMVFVIPVVTILAMPAGWWLTNGLHLEEDGAPPATDATTDAAGTEVAKPEHTSR